MVKVLLQERSSKFLALARIVFYYPIDPILHRPTLPVPGEDRGCELWPSHPLPSYMGHTFPAMCNLWAIGQEVAAVYFADKKTPTPDRIPMGFAEAKFGHLLAWMDTLSADMRRSESSPAHVALFQ